MTEMNAVNTGDNNNEDGGGMGFFKKFFDKNTIIAFAAVFIMAISQHKLFGFWGIVLLAILGPIGATIGNVIRLWVMPDGIFTFQGFWGLVKIKLFWAYGPQFIGTLVSVAIVFSIIGGNAQDKQVVKQAEKDVKVVQKELKDTQSIPELTGELGKTLSELQEEFKGPWQQTEFETTAQFNSRVEKELKNICNKYKSRGIEVGKLYRVHWEFFITDISYDADRKNLVFSTETVGKVPLDSASSLILFGKLYTTRYIGGDCFCLTQISSDQARAIKEKLGFGGSGASGKKIPNDVIKKIVTSDDGCPMLRTVAYVIDENGPEKLQAWNDALKAREKKKDQAVNGTIEKSMSVLFGLPVLTDGMINKIRAFEFQEPQKGEFETEREYRARIDAEKKKAIEGIGVKGIYRYIDSTDIGSLRYDVDDEKLYLNFAALNWCSAVRFDEQAQFVVIDGKPYKYWKDGHFARWVNIPRGQAKEIREKLKSPNMRVHYMINIDSDLNIIAEPACAITSE